MRHIRILLITLPFPDLSIHQKLIEALEGDGYHVLTANHIEAIDLCLSTFRPDLIVFPAGTTRVLIRYYDLLLGCRVPVLFISRSNLSHLRMSNHSQTNIAVLNSKGSVEVILQYVEIFLAEVQQDVDWLNQIYKKAKT